MQSVTITETPLLGPHQGQVGGQTAIAHLQLAAHALRQLQVVGHHQKRGEMCIRDRRNVAAVANHVGVFPERHCRFICGIGGTKRDNQLIDADHISRNLARKFNGFSETLYAPAYVETPELRAAFMQNRLIKATLEQASKADVAIIGLGDMNENSFMVQLGWFTPQEIATARQEQGVVGDLAGYSFFNIQGKPCLLYTSRCV